MYTVARFRVYSVSEPNLTVRSPGYASRTKTAGEFPRRIVSHRNLGQPLSLHRRLRNRQRAHASAAGVEDRIAERRRDHGERRLADAGRLVAVGNDGDFRHTRLSCPPAVSPLSASIDEATSSGNQLQS